MMTGMHNIFLADDNNSNNPISEKKLKQLDGEYALTKTIMGFNFDGVNETLWLEEAKCAQLLMTIHAGFAQANPATPASCSRILRQPWLRSVMPLLLSLPAGDSSPLATRYFRRNGH